MRPAALLLASSTATLVQAVAIHPRASNAGMLLKRVAASTLTGNCAITYYNTDEVPYSFGTSVTFPPVCDQLGHGFRISWTGEEANQICLSWLPMTGLIETTSCDMQAATIDQTPFNVACAADSAADGARICAFYYGALSEKRCVGAGSGAKGAVVQLRPEECLPNDPVSWALYKIKKLEL